MKPWALVGVLLTPLTNQETMAASVPGSRLVVIEDCSHLSTIEQPVAVIQALGHWLDSTRNPS